MRYKIVFDRKKCEDNLVCNAVCPKFWKLDENGKVYLKGAEEVKPGVYKLIVNSVDCNKEAVNGCPKNAITIEKYS